MLSMKQLSLIYKFNVRTVDKRKILTLGKINMAIHDQVLDKCACLVFPLYRGGLNEEEFDGYRKSITNKLKDKGYEVKRVPHPDPIIFILHIDWTEALKHNLTTSEWVALAEEFELAEQV